MVDRKKKIIFHLLSILAFVIVIYAISSNYFIQKANAQNVSGTLTQDTTWGINGSPYTLTDNLTIPSGVSLTVDPGVIVKGANSKTITVNGNLNALGTADSPIVFTMIEDPEFGGNLSNSIHWGGISVNGIFTGDHVKIRYGANNGVNGSSTLNVSGQLSLTNSEVRDSSGDGIFIYETGPSPVTIENTTLSNNKFAIDIKRYDTGTLNITGNNITNNSNAGIYLYQDGTGTLNIAGNNITNNQGCPIYIDLSKLKSSSIFSSLSNNTYTGNKIRNSAVNYIGITGTPTTNLTLSSNTYCLVDSLTIPSGVSLTVDPGVIVKSTDSKTITVNGNLNALGTADSPIVFTMIEDPEFGGNLSNSFYWRGISVTSTGTFTGDHVKIRYGGVNASSMLSVSGQLSLTNSEVRNSSGYGISFNTIAQPILYFNSFKNNSNGMFNNKSSSMTINAQYNYWNSDSGPSIFNSVTGKWIGNGDKVNAGINYTPWLTSEYTGGISGNTAQIATLDPAHTPTEAMVAEPVDTASGAHILERSILDLTGTQKLSFDIRYNSLLLKDGPMGKGWEHPYQTYLESQSNGNMIVHWSANRANTFTLQGSQYTSSEQAIQYDKLTKNADGSFTLKRKDHSILEFNANGKLTELKNGFGQKLVMQYDPSGRLIQITEPVSGKAFTLTYNAQGLISTLTDNANRTVTLTYDQSHNLTGITDSRGTISYTYDSSGRVLTGTDFTGTVTFTDTYDSNGRVTTQTDSLNHQTAFNYDELSQPGELITTVTDRNSQTRSYTFDNKYQLLSVRDELGNVKAYTYDTSGNRLSAKDENGNTTNYTYDIRGNVLTEADPEGHTTAYTYDANDFLLTIKNALNETISSTYNDNGNLLTSTDPLGETTTYTYNTDGQVLSKSIPGYGTATFTYQNGLPHTSTDPLNHTTTFDYDAAGRVITQTDRNGNQTSNTYDPAGNLLSVTDPLNHTTSYTYDANGNKLTETDPLGNTTHYEYNTNGKLTTVTDPLGHQTGYVYDNEERLIQTIVYDGTTEITTVTAYDPAGRVLSVQDPAGGITSYTYDNKGNILTKTEPGKGTTAYTYNKNGKILTETDGAGNTTTYNYNDAGRLTTKTNALGKATTYEYEADGHLVKITDPLGHYVSYTYDSQGNKLSETDANGNVTSYSYDPNGKLLNVTDALNHTTQYQYDAEGRMIKIIDAKGNATTMTYDQAGRLITTTDALGHTITTQYDDKGQITGITDALGHTIATNTYDPTGKLLTVTDALGNLTTNSYDNLGRLATTIDALNRSTTLSYDQLNRLVSVVDPLQGTSSQTFDQGGNITSIVDPNNDQTTYGYDLIGRLISETTAVGSKTHGYNAINLKDSQTNGRGQAADYQYDDAGRLTGFTDPTGSVSYTYDNNGNVLTVTDSAGTITREYDQLNRVTKYTDTSGDTIQYAYDPVGNLTCLTYPGNKEVQYGYNAANQLISVTDWAHRVTQYAYDANGRLLETQRPDGSVQTNIYDEAGRLTELKDVAANGSVINQYDYTYDQAGNITSETSANEQPPLSVSNSTITYDLNNRLATYNGQAVQYDADGNMTSGPLKGAMTSFAYDSRNRLTTAGDTNYVYDAENNRIAVTADSQQTGYLINPEAELSQLLIRTDAQGNKTYYVYGIGLIGQEEANGTYKIYHFDSRGSTTAITDAQGSITDTFAYAPFGQLTQRTGTTDTPFLYNGEDGVMTDSNGLYYMRARYYNPEIMRFMNLDVVQGNIKNGQSLNRYAYVNGNPISQVDPFGLCAEKAGNTFSIESITAGNVINKIKWLTGLETEEDVRMFMEFLSVYSGTAAVAETGSLLSKVPGNVAKAFEKFGKYFTKSDDLEVITGELSQKAGRTAQDLLKEIGIPRTLTEEEINAANAVDLQMMAKRDLKMVNDAANQVGVDRNAFGEYIHELKADLGMKPNENFTWEELIKYAEELKNLGK
jgi:RHS repeat-associated protein